MTDEAKADERSLREAMLNPIEFDIPIKTVSETNRRDHYMARAKRAKRHRGAARLLTVSHTMSAGVRSVPMPGRWNVTLTRIGKRNLDSDNVLAALKATRDGIADALGIDDGDDRVQWYYGQATAKQYAVRVRIEPQNVEPK